MTVLELKASCCFGSRRLRSFSVSGLSVLIQKMLQPSTSFLHHRAEEGSDVPRPPPSAFGLHTLHCRLPGTSGQMCILIRDYTLLLLGRIPTNLLGLSQLPVFQQIKAPKKKDGVDSVPIPVMILI